MACFHPLRAVLVEGTEGRKRISLSRTAYGKGLTLPCGRCVGCLVERARQWAVRLMHEEKMHSESSFVTLTYKDVPSAHEDAQGFSWCSGSVVVADCQQFLKRLRTAIAPKKVRFFLCGEYGEQLGRPHYHAILFGYRPPDGKLYRTSQFGDLFTSEILESLWGHGFCCFGSVSFESARYVAQYVTKKVDGKKADSHYRGKRPEFLLMSRRPGIGSGWYEQFGGDVFPSDEVIVQGKQARPPRFYSERLKDAARMEFPPGPLTQMYDDIVKRRELDAEKLEEFTHKLNGVPAVLSCVPSRNVHRLAVREKVAKAKASLKSRTLENGK